MTGIHRDTFEAGAGCSALMDTHMRDVTCRRLQVDEIWAYVCKKQRQVTAKDDRWGVGGMWTFVALDADTKLVPAYCIGKRDLPTAFMGDLADRLSNRVQLTSDALSAYVDATERAFGADVDYGQLVKAYEAEPIRPGRYSPPRVVSAARIPVAGSPTRPYLYELCRAPGLDDADEHAPVHAPDKRFQQEG